MLYLRCAGGAELRGKVIHVLLVQLVSTSIIFKSISSWVGSWENEKLGDVRPDSAEQGEVMSMNRHSFLRSSMLCGGEGIPSRWPPYEAANVTPGRRVN